MTTNDGQPPRWFEVAGPDGKFHAADGTHAADATIEGDTVVVHASAVSEPVQARHAFEADPQPPPNVVNSAA
jgi:hypothetical protein